MAIYLHGAEVTNVFRLAGSNENSASYALGWTLDQSPLYRSLVLKEAFDRCIDASDAAITLQSHGEDGGHIHGGYGYETRPGGTVLVNCAIQNAAYRLVNLPITVELG